MKRGRPAKSKENIFCIKCRKGFKDERYLKQHICAEFKVKPTDTKLCWYCGEQIQKHNFKRHETSCSKNKFLEVTLPLMSLFCRIINSYNKTIKKNNYLKNNKNMKKIIYDFFKLNNQDLSEKEIENEFKLFFNLAEDNMKLKESQKEIENLKEKANKIKIEKKHKELFNEKPDQEEDKELEDILNKIKEKEEEEELSIMSKSSDEDNEKKYLELIQEQKAIKEEINKIDLRKNKNIIDLKINEEENKKIKEIKDLFGFIPETKYMKIFIDIKNWYIPGISAREIIKKYYIQQNINYNEISKTIEKKFEKKDYPTTDEIFEMSPSLYQKILTLRNNSNYNDDFESFFYLFKNLNENQINFQCTLCDKIIKQKRSHILNCDKFKKMYEINKQKAIEYFMNSFYPLHDKEPILLYYSNKDYEIFKKNIIKDIYNNKFFKEKRIKENEIKLLGNKTKRTEKLTKKKLIKEILNSIDNNN